MSEKVSMSKPTRNPLTAAVGAAFVASLALSPLASAAENPFEVRALSSGYEVAEKGAEGKCGEGKCGAEAAAGKAKAEGKCGEGKCGAEAAEGKAKAEGKCGEGKCGGEAKANDKASDEGKANSEGKCGEGKCGAATTEEAAAE